MRRIGLLLALVAAMLLVLAGVATAQGKNTTTTTQEEQTTAAQSSREKAPLQEASKDHVPDRYIVVLKNDAASAAAGQGPGRVAQEHADKHGLEVSHVYSSAIKGYAAKIPPQSLPALRSEPEVEFVSEDREVRAEGQTVPTGVRRVEADRSSARAGDGKGAVNAQIAVLDSGIYKHPDLNVAGGYNCTGTNRGAYSDGYGHGTHVAGTAAAKDNGSGVVGTAPGARLWAEKVLNDQGNGTVSQVICGVEQVTARAGTIKVANMSLAGPGSDDGHCGSTNHDALHRAICRSVKAGVTYVAAAGNGGGDVSSTVPAAYSEVIPVSALVDYDGKPGSQAKPASTSSCRSVSAPDDTFARFSNYGANVAKRGLGAPGRCILSTYKGGGYATLSGTSMASPHVAGAAALYKSEHPKATPSQVRDALRKNGEGEGAKTHRDPSGLHPEPVLLMNKF